MKEGDWGVPLDSATARREPPRRSALAAAVASGLDEALPRRVRVRVPATTANLGPGFDALGMALSLYNHFEVERCPAGFRVEAEGDILQHVPQDENNLVFRAAQAVWARAGLPPTGWRVRLKAAIPFGCGLGSSASAIVGGAVAANVLAGEPLSTGELLAVAAGLEGHADNVTPALVGGFTVAAMVRAEAGAESSLGSGSRVDWVRLPVHGVQAVVAVPSVRLPTKQSRRVLPETVSFRDAVFNVGRACLLVAALAARDHEAFAAALDDRLHQPYRAAMVPGFGAVVEAAKQAGAMGAVLSGAGPAMLAFVAEDRPAGPVGEAMVAAFDQAGIEARWLALRPDHEGTVAVVPDAGEPAAEPQGGVGCP